VIELGSGPTLVLVAGLPGPWQYVAPAVYAPSAHFRVLASSLGPECVIDADVDRILNALNERRIARATICGISLGGLVALRFAAVHPERTTALVLASAPGPGATLRPRHRFYARWPWLCWPLFILETPFLLRDDIGWTLLNTFARALISAPVSFLKIAKRARLIESTDIAADCTRIVSPTLVITGEPALDHVVPVESTVRYVAAIPGATRAVINGTGHLGQVTQAPEFAGIVRAFVQRVSPPADVA
jgi:pimeloyl-ACP methyl ester carboxylesterase